MLLALLAVSIGIYPPNAEAHAAVAATGAKAYDVIAYTKCALTDAKCLDGVARRASLDGIVTWEYRGSELVLHRFGVAAPAAVAAPVPDDALVIHPGLSLGEMRVRTAHVLMASGLSLLAAAGGVALYSSLTEAKLDTRTQRGALTQATPQYDDVHVAQIVAVALASTGLASIAAGTTILAITPNGAALQTRW